MPFTRMLGTLAKGSWTGVAAERSPSAACASSLVCQAADQGTCVGGEVLARGFVGSKSSSEVTAGARHGMAGALALSKPRLHHNYLPSLSCW